MKFHVHADYAIRVLLSPGEMLPYKAVLTPKDAGVVYEASGASPIEAITAAFALVGVA